MECDYDQRRASTTANRPDAGKLSAHVQEGRRQKEYAGGIEFVLPRMRRLSAGRDHCLHRQGVSIVGLPALQRSQEGSNTASFVRRIDERGLTGIIGGVGATLVT